MSKKCQILNNKVHWIIPEDSLYSYEDLIIKDIEEKTTFAGNEIVEGCFYDELHDIYFDSNSEYKSFLEYQNNLILKDLEEKYLKLQNENKNLNDKLDLLNEKIDSLANLMVFLK